MDWQQKWTNRISSVQLLSCVQLCNPMDCSMPGFPVHHQPPQSLLKLRSTESVMPSTHLILCHPLLLLPSIFPSIRVFSNESVICIKWPKYWSFSFSTSPSSEYSGLVSFRIDWLNLLAVQGTLKSLLQHHSSKASNLWCSALFMVQLSHPNSIMGQNWEEWEGLYTWELGSRKIEVHKEKHSIKMYWKECESLKIDRLDYLYDLGQLTFLGLVSTIKGNLYIRVPSQKCEEIMLSKFKVLITK